MELENLSWAQLIWFLYLRLKSVWFHSILTLNCLAWSCHPASYSDNGMTQSCFFLVQDLSWQVTSALTFLNNKNNTTISITKMTIFQWVPQSIGANLQLVGCYRSPWILWRPIKWSLKLVNQANSGHSYEKYLYMKNMKL